MKTPDQQASPIRDMYVSDAGWFTYNPNNDEFGTNRRNPCTPALAQAALKGIDEFDRLQDSLGNGERLAGNIDIFETTDDRKTIEGLRIDNPRLLQEGLQAYMHLPVKEGQESQSHLVLRAESDLYDFVHELCVTGVLRNTSVPPRTDVKG